MAITAVLREEVAAAASAVREMLASAKLPPPLTGEAAAKRCKNCSLRERCQPVAAASPAMRAARSTLFDPDA